MFNILQRLLTFESLSHANYLSNRLSNFSRHQRQSMFHVRWSIALQNKQQQLPELFSTIVTCIEGVTPQFVSFRQSIRCTFTSNQHVGYRFPCQISSGDDIVLFIAYSRCYGFGRGIGDGFSTANKIFGSDALFAAFGRIKSLEIFMSYVYYN